MNSTIETGNVHRHVKAPGSTHSQNGRKILIAVLVIASVGIFISSATVVQAEVPWWVTVGSDTVTGAVVGAAAGGPIGALAGAVGGATIGALTVYFFNHPSNGIQQSTFNETPYALDTMEQAYQALTTATDTGVTTSSLVNTSYYYFAQEMESLAVRYINTSLNETQLALASGIYQQLDNIQSMTLTPQIKAYMFLDQYGLQNMAGSSTTGETSFNLQMGLIGIPITNDNYYFIDANNSFAFWTSGYVKLQNVFTGNIVNISETLPTIQTESYIYSQPSTGNYFEYHPIMPSLTQGYASTNFGFSNGYSTSTAITTQNIPIPQFTYVTNTTNKTQPFAGLYKVISSSGEVTTSSLSLGNSWSGTIQNSIDWTPIVFGTNGTLNTGIASRTSVATISPSNNQQYTIDNSWKNPVSTLPSYYPNGAGVEGFDTTNGAYVDFNAYNQIALFNFTLPTHLMSTLQNTLSDAYSSAQTYVQMLRNFGYTNYSQIPANETIPFPSWSVPLNMLNGHFNETQLLAMYYAYLDSLNATFHNNDNRLPANWTFNDTKFLNSFTIETGILNITNSFDGYHNITGEFMIETNSQHMNFAVGQTTKFTALTPIVAINATLGDPTYISGDLIEASPNSTIYVTALSVNGTSVTSTSIYPAPITVVISPFVSPVTQHNGGFFMQKEGPLATWEWILIGLISVVAVAAIFERRD